jgi:hypothetical protein
LDHQRSQEDASGQHTDSTWFEKRKIGATPNSCEGENLVASKFFLPPSLPAEKQTAQGADSTSSGHQTTSVS